MIANEEHIALSTIQSTAEFTGQRAEPQDLASMRRRASTAEAEARSRALGLPHRAGRRHAPSVA